MFIKKPKKEKEEKLEDNLIKDDKNEVNINKNVFLNEEVITKIKIHNFFLFKFNFLILF